MRRLAIAAAALAVGVAPAAAQEHGGHGEEEGATAEVSMLATAYAPEHVDVLAGDTVMWANTSYQRHTATAEDESWSSETIFPHGSFSRRFEATGEVRYYCRVHPFMRGQVGVHRVLLERPRESAAPGRPFVLTGRAALPPQSAVAIEADAGGGFQPAGSATVGDDGRFRASVTPRASASYRAVARGEASPAVELLVVDRKVLVARGRRGRDVVVAVRVLPATPGGTVVLQLRLRERFGWWPTRRARLDDDSTARFTLPLRRSAPGRVVLTQSDGATALARSRTLRLRAGR
jgi:plastocyanin